MKEEDVKHVMSCVRDPQPISQSCVSMGNSAIPTIHLPKHYRSAQRLVGIARGEEQLCRSCDHVSKNTWSSRKSQTFPTYISGISGKQHRRKYWKSLISPCSTHKPLQAMGVSAGESPNGMCDCEPGQDTRFGSCHI